MPIIVINDAMAVIRARLERDLARFSLRNFVNDLNASPHIQIWAWDGAKNKASRQAIYPGYKANRVPAAVSIYEGMMLFKRVLQNTRGISIEVPGYEGDDVIAAIVKQWAGKAPVVINTVDYDLRMLVNEHPTVSCTVDAKPHVDDRHIHLYKCWVGDPSDEIPGVKGFGKGAWEKADKAELRFVTDMVLKQQGMPEQQSLVTLQPKHLNWLAENQDTFRAMYAVTDFLHIPQDVLDRHTVKGVPNLEAVDDMLKEFFL
jgi:5'-3' exonuclease